MSSSKISEATPSKGRRYRWIIEKYDTGDWLGTKMSGGDMRSGFGVDATVPLTYGKYRAVRAAWFRHCVQEGYLKMGVTLPKEGRRYHPGPNFNSMPRVRFVEVEMRETAFEIPTLGDLGVIKGEKI